MRFWVYRLKVDKASGESFGKEFEASGFGLTDLGSKLKERGLGPGASFGELF